MSESFEDRMRGFIAADIGIAPEEIEPDTGLFSDGYLDSFSMVEVVQFIETEYGIRFGTLDIHLENLDTINRMKAFVLSKSPDAKV